MQIIEERRMNEMKAVIAFDDMVGWKRPLLLACLKELLLCFFMMSKQINDINDT